MLEANPAEPVRSPKLSADVGKTAALTAEEARELLDSIVEEKKELPQLRDRAIIGVTTYTFARVSAVVGLDVGDYFRAGRRWKIRLHEKGGQRRTVPVHHKAREYLDAYLEERASAKSGMHLYLSRFADAPGSSPGSASRPRAPYRW